MSARKRYARIAVVLILCWMVIGRGDGFSQSGPFGDSNPSEGSRERKVRRLEAECLRIQTSLEAGDRERAELQRRAMSRLTVLYKFRVLGYAFLLFHIGGAESTTEASFVAERMEQADRELHLRWHECMLKQRHLGALLVQRQIELTALKGNREPEAESASQPSSGQAPAEPAAIGAPIRDRPEPSGTAVFKKIPFRKPIFSETAEGFSAMRGVLPPPTVGKVVATYGSRSSGKAQTFLHVDGVTFLAPKGQPVGAVFDGMVVYSDWLKEYGNVMIIDHGDHYHSLMAHVDQFIKHVGDPVKGGEVVATVGDTGSSGTTQLYFEIRHHGNPMNPMEWLAVDQSSKE